MEVYLDNSATTRCLDAVADIVGKTMREDFGNPSSRHLKGVQAERYLKEARGEIAKTLKVKEKEIYFTSGGTEADNWALIGAAFANRRAGNHLITTQIEHPAVLQAFAYLEEQGFRVSYLPVDDCGRISLKELEQELTPETILVSVMYVNNEVGTREPVEEAARIIKTYNPQILFHVDAVQAYGKYHIYPQKAGIDLLAVSGHKIHGPKGIGFLYVAEKAKIKPLILGGGQQGGMRSGTDNVPGAAGLAVAAKEAYRGLDTKREILYGLKERFIEGVRALPDVRIQGQAKCTKEAPREECGAPHIVSVSFLGVRSEVLLHALEERGIYVSSGSACSSNKKQAVSPVLAHMGLPKECLESTLRFSFSTFTTAKEIDYCLEQLESLLPVLRKYQRHSSNRGRKI